MLRLDAIRLGLAGGIIKAFMIFCLTLIAHTMGYGLELVSLFKSLFIGYEINTMGSLIGGLHGFICGFGTYFLLGFIYNLLGPKE